MTQYIVMVSLATGSADSLHFFGPFTNVGVAFDFAKRETNAIVMTLRHPTPISLVLARSEFKEME